MPNPVLHNISGIKHKIITWLNKMCINFKIKKVILIHIENHSYEVNTRLLHNRNISDLVCKQ